MCNFYSCIVTKKGEVLEAPNSNSHESIITNYALEDVSLKDRSFVRIEITPNDANKMFSRDRTNWTFKVDEPKTIPVWFEEDSTKYINLAWGAWQKFMDKLPLVDNLDSVLPDTITIPSDWNKDDNLFLFSHILKAGLFGILFDYLWLQIKNDVKGISTIYIGSKIFDHEKLKKLAKERNIGV